MNFLETGFRDLYVIQLKPIADNRGYFVRTFDQKEFEQINFTKTFVQMNVSFNKNKGTLRGMHFQIPPAAETKLVRCSSGSVYDVVVDLRQESKTFHKWFGVELSKENNKMLLIPEGFAHGFITLEDNSEMVYCHTEFYKPEFERGLRYNDPKINIEWPAELTVVSEKDKSYPLL